MALLVLNLPTFENKKYQLMTILMEIVCVEESQPRKNQSECLNFPSSDHCQGNMYVCGGLSNTPINVCMALYCQQWNKSDLRERQNLYIKLVDGGHYRVYPYSEKLWLWTWKCCPSLQVMVFHHIQIHVFQPANNIHMYVCDLRTWNSMNPKRKSSLPLSSVQLLKIYTIFLPSFTALAIALC